MGRNAERRRTLEYIVKAWTRRGAFRKAMREAKRDHTSPMDYVAYFGLVKNARRDLLGRRKWFLKLQERGP